MDTQKFLEDARRATERRMTAAERIAEALATREEKRSAFEAATADVEAAFKEAEQSGWTKAELRSLRPSDMAPKSRTSRPRRRTSRSSVEEHPSIDAADSENTPAG